MLTVLAVRAPSLPTTQAKRQTAKLRPVSHLNGAPSAALALTLDGKTLTTAAGEGVTELTWSLVTRPRAGRKQEKGALPIF